jgi:SAM-dependent methyltransferase
MTDGKSRAASRTAEAFGYEWLNFTEMHEEYKEQFLDWIKPLNSDFFKGKIVMDAGCGMGRHTYFSSEFGSKFVVGVDISESIKIAREHTKDKENVGIVKGDIYNLPFKDTFDLVYCIGVLHHLPEPEGGFKSLVKHVKKGGTIFAWVYGKESETMMKPLLVLRKLTTKMPLGMLKGFSLAMTVMLWPIVKLSKQAFFSYLSKFSFKQVHSIIFDQLVAPIANYYTKEEFEKWFENAGLKEVVITSRNNNSWRGMGVKAD